MLEARGVTYAYPGARTPLYRDFDLAVGPDERVAISAPSGFGKTTLCRMLAGYDRPQKGEILVDGAPLPKRGMCPVQLILQHPETAVDPRMRMSQTLAEAGEVPQRLLDDLGIQKRWLARFPHELSGGEQQRVAIARALVNSPAVLLADEPSGNLDTRNKEEVHRLFFDLRERLGQTIVLVTHDESLALRADRRIVMSDGLILPE